MQQTEFYHLNKLERDDTFSPEALNQNAESVETADYLNGVAVRAEAHARSALDARVTLLEAKKVVVGTYVGEGKDSPAAPHVISLGFTPLGVIVQGGYSAMLATQDAGCPSMTILDGGFGVTRGQTSDLDLTNIIYHYIAFG